MSISATSISGVPASSNVRPLSLTAAYYASFLALGLTVGSLGPTLPSLANQTHVGLSAISYLFTARSMGYVLGSVKGGHLFDRRSGNPVMAVMVGLMAIMMAMVPLVPYLWLLLVVMIILGAAESALDVGGNTLLTWVHGKRVAPFMNAMHSFFGVGALIAPIVVAQTEAFKRPMTHSYFVLALLILPVAIYTLRLASPVPVAAVKHEMSPLANTRLAFLIAFFLFLYVGAEVGFAGWIFTYATELKLSVASTAAYLTSLFWGSLTLGRVVTIPIAVRFSLRSILLVSLGGCLLSLGLILVSPESFAAVLIGTICLGLSMASIFPTMLSLASRRVKMTGQLTGWFIVASSAGAMLIPLVIGQAFASIGPRVVIIVTMITLLAAVGVLAFVIRNSEHISSEGRKIK